MQIKKRILLIYSNEYFLTSPVYPFGLDVIAQQLESKGYKVCIELPFLTHQDASKGILATLKDFQPDIIGMSIRNIDTAMACDPSGTFTKPGIRTHFFLPNITKMIETIKKHCPNVPVVAGGTGFSVSPEAILKFINADFGITGHGAGPMSMFAEAFPDLEKIKQIPNLISSKSSVSQNKKIFTDIALLPEKRNKAFNHSFETIGMPVMTSSGCCMNCSYCVEPAMTKQKVTLRPQKEIINELLSISDHYQDVSEIFFVNTEFNIPGPRHSLALLKDILSNQLNERFRFSSQFLPLQFTEEYVRHLSLAGFYVILTCDSFFDEILNNNNSPYREKDIIQTLDFFEKFKVPCTLNLIFGLPGETFESINHTLDMIKRYTASGTIKFEYTTGARIYNNTTLARYVGNNQVKDHIYGTQSKGYTEPCFFSTPASPLELNAYIEPRLPFKQEFISSCTEENRLFRKIVYDTDQGLFEKASLLFSNAPIKSKERAYDYLFRKFTANGLNKLAKQICLDFIFSIENEDTKGIYFERIPVIKYYLSFL